MVSETGQNGRRERPIRSESRLMGANGSPLNFMGFLGLHFRAYLDPNRRGKLAQAARDDFKRGFNVYRLGPIAFNNAAKVIGFVMIAAAGAHVAGWVVGDTRPVKFLSRKVLTPVVRPGDDVEVELTVLRDKRCPQVVNKVVNSPDRKRDPVVRPLPENFGKMGIDRYVTTIGTNPRAPYGEGFVYTYVEHMCNPYEWWKPKESGPWVDRFVFGEKTIHKTPEEVQNSLESQ